MALLIRARRIGLALLLNVMAAAAADSPTPALQAYADVSVWRDRHEEVIWNGADASPEQLQAIIADLDQGLAKLDEPLNLDLAEGNVYLRYRRFNFLIDKVKVHARLGETDQAFAAWDALSRMSWSPQTQSWLTEDEHVKPLLADPRAAPILARNTVARRWAGAPALQTPFQPTLPVAERIAGLSLVWSMARDGFVWFDHVPELDWDRAYLDALPRVIAAERTDDYYRELMRFTALLGDGHSNAYPPKELQPQFYSRPGLRTALIEGRVLVTEVGDPKLTRQGVRVGDELSSIDGVAVHDYAARQVAPFASSSTAQDKALRTYTYALLAGAAAQPVALQLRHANGRSLEVSAARSGYESTAAPATERFELRKDGIAILKAGQFGSDAALKLLEQHLAELMTARGFILDLRGNGGGSSNNGWDLLTYLSAEPLQQPMSQVRETSPLDRARGGKNSELRWRALPAEPYARKREQIFSGPVAMLIDAGTFSAAEDTAAVFKLMRRGPIIGSASGGSTGQPLLFGLPGGGSARICVKRDSYPDGSTFVGSGVIPDIVIEPTVKSIRNGTDPALERAVRELKVPPKAR